MAPLSPIFTAAAEDFSGPSLSTLIGDLKKSSLSIGNRLRSIREDAEFVADVAATYGGRPLVANERCGSWYVDPAAKAGSAYFKSTDGHAGVWKFSARRLNLHLLDLIERCDGCIIVDSTRRGKRMPDALSKTVPIWCAVVNAVVFSHPPRLHTPPRVVSPSEHDSISALLPSFVDLFHSLHIDVAELSKRLTKPLRPLWVTRDSILPDPKDTPGEGSIFDDHRPVICCTASKRVGGEIGEGGYVQGAADDTENWARGLTASVFWSNARELLAAATTTSGSELAGLVDSLVSSPLQGSATATTAAPRRVAPHISVCPLPVPETLSPGDCCIAIQDSTTLPDAWVKSPRLMEVGLGKGKTASRNLRHALPAMLSFLSAFAEIAETTTPTTASTPTTTTTTTSSLHVTIACPSGKDVSVGVALAVLCLVHEVDGHVRIREPAAVGVSKDAIKATTASIMMQYPEANPSRATLQSVNSFLMS